MWFCSRYIELNNANGTHENQFKTLYPLYLHPSKSFLELNIKHYVKFLQNWNISSTIGACSTRAVQSNLIYLVIGRLGSFDTYLSSRLLFGMRLQDISFYDLKLKLLSDETMKVIGHGRWARRNKSDVSRGKRKERRNILGKRTRDMCLHKVYAWDVLFFKILKS